MNILRVIIFFASLIFGIFILINLCIPGTWSYSEDYRISQNPEIVRYELTQFPVKVHQNAWSVFESPIRWKSDNQNAANGVLDWTAGSYGGQITIRADKFEWMLNEPFAVKGMGEYSVRNDQDSSTITLNFEMKMPFFYRIWQLFLPSKIKPVLQQQLKLFAAHCSKVDILPDSEDLKWRWLTLKGMRVDTVPMPYENWQLKVWDDLDRIKQVENSPMSDDLGAFVFALDGSYKPSKVLMGRITKNEYKIEAPIDTIRWEGMYIYKYPGYYETLVFGADEERSKAHRYIRAYLETEEIEFRRPVVELYKYWSKNEEDSAKWQTQIIYGY